jgi:hypothetical protein
VQERTSDEYNISKLTFCEHCVFGKHKRVSFTTSTHKSKGIPYYVYFDLWRPYCTLSIGDSRYILTIIDDYTHRVWPYFFKHKSEAFFVFKECKILIENCNTQKFATFEIGEK